jgi:hypothetical protein
MMPSEADASTQREKESVVLASFEGRRAAERMLWSLGRDFRKKARKGHAGAFVVSGENDGSLKVTESRVLGASDFMAAVIRISLSLAMGFLAIFSTAKGALGGVRAVRKHHGHVGSEEQRAHEILAEAGPNAALALIRCSDDEMRQTVAARASEDNAGHCWDGSLTDFLSSLDPGTQHDWVRKALGEPTPDG